jgi:broad specificity phosphatase PhoE
MVKKFYIMRHGETFATKRNTGYGWKILTASILEEGKPIIEKQGKYLRNKEIEYCVASPIKRCKQTSAIVRAESGKDIFFDRRLSEFFLESFGGFKKRVRSFLKEMDEKGYEEVLIITHGAVIAALTHLLSRDTFQISEITDYPKPGVMTIIEREKIAQLIDFNIDQPDILG